MFVFLIYVYCLGNTSLLAEVLTIVLEPMCPKFLSQRNQKYLLECTFFKCRWEKLFEVFIHQEFVAHLLYGIKKIERQIRVQRRQICWVPLSK